MSETERRLAFYLTKQRPHQTLVTAVGQATGASEARSSFDRRILRLLQRQSMLRLNAPSVAELNTDWLSIAESDSLGSSFARWKVEIVIFRRVYLVTARRLKCGYHHKSANLQYTVTWSLMGTTH